MNEVDWVMDRLKASAPEGHKLYEQDEGLLRDDAARLINDEKWLPAEVFAYLRLTEEVNPFIPEGEALKRASQIYNNVQDRLKKESL